MSDYGNIVNNLTYQYDCLHMRNQYPSRVILGIEIVKILESHCNYYLSIYETSNGDFLFMNLPVTVDYKDKWIMMVCAGNEWDGRNFLNNDEN